MSRIVITTSIEIAASPAETKKKYKLSFSSIAELTHTYKFLQFDQIPKYHPNGFIKSLSPATPNAPLDVGNKMHVVVELGDFEAPILENSATTFCWGGKGLLGTFNGDHAFHFTESKTTAGGTTFIQEEQFSGVLAFIIGDGTVGKMLGFREKTREGFEGFNRDFKKWVESGE